MVDLGWALRTAIRTGKVVIGSNKTLKAAKMGDARLIIMARNCPQEIREDLEYYCKLAGIPIYVYDGTSIELGKLCGKPFPIASMAIKDPGESNILEIIKEAKAQR